MAKRQIDLEAIKEKEEEVEPVDPIEEAKNTILDNIEGVLDPAELESFSSDLNNLINIVDEQALHAVREEISVFYPEQTFAPYPYNSFRCGNLWYKTVMLPGETREEAYDRAWAYLSAMVKKQYREAHAEFEERYRSHSI